MKVQLSLLAIALLQLPCSAQHTAPIPGLGADGYWKEGVVYQDQKEYTKALQSYRHSLALRHNSRVYFDMATAFIAINDYSSALKTLDMARTSLNAEKRTGFISSIDLATIYLKMADIYQKMKDPANELEYLRLAEDAAENDGTSNRAFKNNMNYLLGSVYQRLNDQDNALDYLNAALLGLTPKDSALRKKINLVIAATYVDRRDDARARRFYILSGELNPYKNGFPPAFTPTFPVPPSATTPQSPATPLPPTVIPAPAPTQNNAPALQ